MRASAADRLVDRVRLRMAAADALLPVAEIARQEAQLLVDSTVLDEMSNEVSAQLRGAGRLEMLIAVPGVTDVLVNGPSSVWVDDGNGLRRTEIEFSSEAEVRSLAVRLAAQAGRRLDDAVPFVDAMLPDGTRLHAMLPPLVRAPTISLRVLARRHLSLADLIAVGSIPPDVATFLACTVTARMTTIISGGTGSGKTTVLGALLGTVPPNERIITIEDAAELTVRHPHVVSLVARGANVEGAGVIDMRELVRQSLRMRGDRLVVGEFRGGEVVELLAALNTGHPGGAATVHANSVRDVPARLTALAALGGMPADVLRAQASSALDLLVHVARTDDGRRRVREIALWSPDPEAESAIWSEGLGWSAAGDALRQRLSPPNREFQFDGPTP